ncbi:MAG: hypothetical protein ACXAEX_17450 [Promethearchaeota archaeon]|jgi:hypothetical protein
MEDYEIRKQLDACKKQLEAKDSLLRLKDEQVNNLEDSIKWKDEQIKVLENSSRIKDDKARALEETIGLREEEIKRLGAVSVDKNVLKEKDEKIQELEKELDLLNEEFTKVDEDLVNLELENEKLRNAQSSSKEANIIDYTNINITKTEILEKMREILPNSQANVLLITPNIEDLQELYLYEVRSSVSIRIACSINPGIDEHSEWLEEFESLDNINIRNYPMEDRYALVRDGEELIFGVIGKSDNNNMIVHTKDSKHIKLLRSLAEEGWLRGRTP